MHNVKFKDYFYVNIKSGDVHKFRGQFYSIPDAMDFAYKQYLSTVDTVRHRGYMVLLDGNGLPSYPVGYKHPKNADMAMSRLVDIKTAQRYLKHYILLTSEGVDVSNTYA